MCQEIVDATQPVSALDQDSKYASSLQVCAFNGGRAGLGFDHSFDSSSTAERQIRTLQ